MRDIVWTVIVIWLVYKLVNIFKKPESAGNSHTESQIPKDFTANSSQNAKKAVRNSADHEGEYIDFEEVK